MAALIALSSVVYLITGTYTPRTTATGSLVPQGGSIRVIAPMSGMVSERRVQEGQKVQRGEVLFVLRDERRNVDRQSSTRISDLRSESQVERRKQLERLKENAISLNQKVRQGNRSQFESVSEELVRNEQEIALQQSRLASAERMLEKHRDLAHRHFISDASLLEKEDQSAALRAQLLSLQRSRDQLKRTAAALQSEFDQLPTRTATQIAEIDRDLAALSAEVTETSARDGYAITAPLDGTVTAIIAEQGQVVSSQALAVIVPEGRPLVAHLYAPSKSVGFVRPGQAVRLRYQPFPFQRYGMQRGVVTEVSASPLSPDDVAMLPNLPFLPNTTVREPLYRVVVALDSPTIQADGQTRALLPGTALEADIEQSEQRLIDWVFAPLKSAAARL